MGKRELLARAKGGARLALGFGERHARVILAEIIVIYRGHLVCGALLVISFTGGHIFSGGLAEEKAADLNIVGEALESLSDMI